MKGKIMNETNQPSTSTPPRKFFRWGKLPRWAIYFEISFLFSIAAFLVWELGFAAGNWNRVIGGILAVSLTGFTLALAAFWKAIIKD